MESKWHNISIRSQSFKDLLEIQRRMPIRVSIPQTIEWLIKVGQKQINQSDYNYEDNRTIQSE
jgi:c-di-GMP-binding flagellar brake protein YcgR